MHVSSGGSGKEQDFELNIASIIDCFTVLITYLLVSASFISLSVFDVNVPTLVAFEDRSMGAIIDVQVDIDEKKNMQVKVSGAERQQVVMPAKDNNFDLESLKVFLTELKGRWPEMTGVVLSAEKSVVYLEVMKVIDSIRNVIPGVALGDREQG